MATNLTPEEKNLLKQIELDRMAFGAFCGMVFNAWTATLNASSGERAAIIRDNETAVMTQLLKDALQVRLLAKKLTEQ